MTCAWCVNPHPGKLTRLVNPPSVAALCRDCRAIARREGRIAP